MQVQKNTISGQANSTNLASIGPTLLACPQHYARQYEFGDLGKKIIIKRVRRVRGAMIMRIAEFRRVGPHDGRNAGLPEWRVIAPEQVSEVLFHSKVNLQRENRKLRNVGCRQVEQVFGQGVGMAI